MASSLSTRPWHVNPSARTWRAGTTIDDPGTFHRSMNGYRASDLVELDGVAAALGIGRVLVKDESDRFGLPAFKALGASWAIARTVTSRLALPRVPASFDDLRAAVAEHRGLTLVTATDGNHGRAVARVASWLGLSSRVYIPGGLSDAARNGITAEGAELIESDSIYDEVVRLAADSTAGRADELLVQDTSWPGYEDVPQWIVDGYSTLFTEADAQLTELGAMTFDLVVVPTGVGSLLQSAIEHYRGRSRWHPGVLGVEPVTAACVTLSRDAGEIVSVDTSTPTMMAGLNCGTPSSIAWPALRDGADATIGVTDDEAVSASRRLATFGISSGPCGAASLAGLRAVVDDDSRRLALGLGPDSVVVLISTESLAANPLPDDDDSSSS